MSWEVQGGRLVPAWAPRFGVTSWEKDLVRVGDALLVLGDAGMARFVDPTAQTISPIQHVQRPIRACAAAVPDLLVIDTYESMRAYAVP